MNIELTKEDLLILIESYRLRLSTEKINRYTKKGMFLSKNGFTWNMEMLELFSINELEELLIDIKNK